MIEDKRMRLAAALRQKGVALVSSCFAALMLCLVPLVFRDAFFDINRIKVYTVYAGTAVLLVAMLLALAIAERKEALSLPPKDVLICFGLMALFLLSALASYFASGFDTAVLLGNIGRYCGLLFFVCCILSFYIIACGALSCDRLLPMIEITACIVALLGVLNALGVDPLGFYARIRKGQEKMFMSTIGHFDFYGTYLVMLFPLCGASFVFSKKGGSRALGFAGVMLCAMGAAASRTDSALAGIHLGCIALLALSGGSLLCMARALAVWSVGFVSLPIVGKMLAFSTLDVAFSGPHAMLCDRPIALIAAAALAAGAAFLFVLSRRGVRAPGKKKTTAVILGLLFGALLVIVVLAICFTVIYPEAKIGKAANFLRFNDRWGTYRGFVYTRALDAFGGFTLKEKLFGKGLDTTKRILESYYDHPVIEIVGVFDDAHNQLIQLLITGGLFCAVSFAAFYVYVLYTLYRRSGRDPLICGAAASVFAYSVVMLINVTQPILIATYFSICALALSRVCHRAQRGNQTP